MPEAAIIAVANAIQAVAEYHTKLLELKPEIADVIAEREKWWQDAVWSPLGNLLTGQENDDGTS